MMIKAQVLTNNGTITIVGSGSLIVEGGMTNGSGSALNIQSGGSMSVSGDLTIQAGSTVAQDGLITFNGSGNSNVTSNGVDLGNVTINKTSGDVVLVDPMSMDGLLTLTSGDLVLGGSNLLMTSTATTTAGSASSHVNTNGMGRMTKAFAAASAFTFPVGDGTYFTPLMSTPSGTPGSVAVAVENAAPANVVGTNFLTRNWKVNTQGFTGNALLGTYNEGDDVGITVNESLIKGAVYNGSAWTFNSSTGNPGANQVGATAPQGDFVFSGLNTIGTVKLKAFLAGAYETGSMHTKLKDANLLPTMSPYSQNNVTIGSIPNQPITDWVLLELTNPSNGSDPPIYKSAFIKSNGLIVDTDGLSDPQIIGAYSPAIVKVIHRNHLPVRTTDSGISTTTPSLQDFTINSNVYSNPLVTSNGPQRNLSGVHVMWGGEVNSDNIVTYLDGFNFETFEPIPSDALAILTSLGNVFSNSLANTYSKFDTNLDGTVTYLDGFNFETFEPIPSDALAVLTYIGNVFSNLIYAH